jgi:hypothetical protein
LNGEIILKEFIYIYNIQQATYYMCDCNIKPVEIGKNREGKIFFRFVRAETKAAFDGWCNRKVS